VDVLVHKNFHFRLGDRDGEDLQALAKEGRRWRVGVDPL
jgi:hypothetical protein